MRNYSRRFISLAINSHMILCTIIYKMHSAGAQLIELPLNLFSKLRFANYDGRNQLCELRWNRLRKKIIEKSCSQFFDYWNWFEMQKYDFIWQLLDDVDDVLLIQCYACIYVCSFPNMLKEFYSERLRINRLEFKKKELSMYIFAETLE